MTAPVPRASLVALALLLLPAGAQAASAPAVTSYGVRSPSVLAGEDARYFAIASDPDGDAVSLSWSFDDGTTAVGDEVEKVWRAPGAHVAVVTPSDSTGRGGAPRTLTVQVQPDADDSWPTGDLPRGYVQPAVPYAEASLTRAILRLTRAGAVRVRIACHDGGPKCEGEASLTRRSRRLGRSGFAIAPGARATVVVHVAQGDARRLRRHRLRKVKMSLTLGGQAVDAYACTLRTR
jgi:PKD domain-containing protein